jgi:hypothetical protein
LGAGIAGIWTGDPAVDVGVYQIALTFWNIFLVCGCWVLLLALLLAQYDRLPTSAHGISFLSGMIAVLFVIPGQTVVSSLTHSASFSPLIMGLVIVLVLIFLIFAVTPLVKKLRHTRHLLQEKQYVFLLIGYILIASYFASILYSNMLLINEIRRAIFPTGLLFWNLSLFIDPLTIVITKSQVQKVIILTRVGLPLFSYDFEQGQSMDTTLISGLLSAIKSSMEDILVSGSPLTSIIFENSEMNFINGEETVLIILARQALSSNFRLLANLLLHKFERTYANDLKKSGISVDSFEGFEEQVQRMVNRVVFAE